MDVPNEYVDERILMYGPPDYVNNEQICWITMNQHTFKHYMVDLSHNDLMDIYKQTPFMWKKRIIERHSHHSR